MPHALPFFLFIVVLAPVLLGHQLGGGWTFITPIALFGVIGALDMLIGRGETGGYARSESPAHRIAPILWLPLQVALIVWLLVNLTHHADHHMRPGERYQRLGMVEGAGKLPFGYATTFLFVLVPPLWFRMMNPRVQALRAAHPV